jgi:mRNA interferase MazF
MNKRKRLRMARARRGEVWTADLGYAAKVRRVLIHSVRYSDTDYALLAVLPHTTLPRGSQFEVNVSVKGLKPGAFNVQGIIAIPPTRLLRKIAGLETEQMSTVESFVKKWFGLSDEQ